MTDPEALERELTRVRVEGYALEDEEQVDGLRGLAAPVTGPDGEVIAAIALAAWDPRPLDREAGHVRAAARAASEALAAAPDRYALKRGIVYRLLASYGLAPVNAFL
jgi:IclR family acetate operon transcriptional repressor